MTMRERIARAICVANGLDPDEDDNNVADGLFFPNWTMFEASARAAISALAEPTPEMIEAGMNAILEDDGTNISDLSEDEIKSGRDGMRAAIAAAIRAAAKGE